MSSLITPKEVVGLLAKRNIHVCEDTVRNWTMRGLTNKNSPQLRYRLGAIRIGGRIHILRESLMTFIPLLNHLEE